MAIAVNISKNIFFIMKYPHVHLKYVKYSNDALNAVGGFDFTKYSPSAMFQYVP